MKPVFMTEYDALRGDCERASVATIFDLEIEQVPHFRLFNDETWYNVFCCFIWSMGYEVIGTGQQHKDKSFDPIEHDIDGHLLACVPSLTFKGKFHSVVITKCGEVVHDPNKNKLWLGKDVIRSKELLSWDIIKKRES